MIQDETLLSAMSVACFDIFAQQKNMHVFTNSYGQIPCSLQPLVCINRYVVY